jgi:hypothetical protein
MKLPMMLGALAGVLSAAALSACGPKSPPPQAHEAPPPPPPNRPPPPSGPTRTDFKTIARTLVQRCVAGGWISRWRSEQPNVDVARPRIYLRDFEDKTEQNLDPSYLHDELEKDMRTSGVFDMAAESGPFDFIGRGRLLRLAERSGSGRVSVYTAVLEMLDPTSQKVAYSCEATVKGEM